MNFSYFSPTCGDHAYTHTNRLVRTCGKLFYLLYFAFFSIFKTIICGDHENVPTSSSVPTSMVSVHFHVPTSDQEPTHKFTKKYAESAFFCMVNSTKTIYFHIGVDSGNGKITLLLNPYKKKVHIFFIQKKNSFYSPKCFKSKMHLECS